MKKKMNIKRPVTQRLSERRISIRREANGIKGAHQELAGRSNFKAVPSWGQGVRWLL
jgi:hypothetical protein